MNFDDNPEEAAFRQEARTWLEANARLLREGETNQGFESDDDDDDSIAAAQAWQAKKASAGWACITWPMQYGGREATPIQSVIYTSYRTLTALSRGQTPGPEGSISKLVSAKMDQEMASLASSSRVPWGPCSTRTSRHRKRNGSKRTSGHRACGLAAAPMRSCATSLPSTCCAYRQSRASIRPWRSAGCRAERARARRGRDARRRGSPACSDRARCVPTRAR